MLQAKLSRFSALLLLPCAGCGSSETEVLAPPSVIRFEKQPRSVLSLPMIQASRDPKVGIRASGAVYLLAPYQGASDMELGLFISRDGGDQFARPVRISPEGSAVSSHGENSPTLAFGGTEVYALWERKKPRGGTDLMVSRSLRFGHHFDPPVKVTDKAEPSSNAFSSLAVAPNGDPYVVWLDGRDKEVRRRGMSSVYLSRSRDRGGSFGVNHRVFSGVCPCCRATLAFGSKGEIFVSWRHVFKAEVRDVVIAASQDGGKSFSSPVRVSQDNWTIAGCPHSGASLLYTGQRLYVAWFSDPDEGPPGVRLSWSDNSGASFRPAIYVSEPVVDANHPHLALSEKGKILLIFEGRDPETEQGWGPAQPYFVQIDSGGGTSTAVAVPGSGSSVSYPFIASGGQGRVYVSWTQSSGQGPEVVMSRGRLLL